MAGVVEETGGDVGGAVVGAVGDDRQPRLAGEQIERIDAPVALLFLADDGEQPGEQPLQDDAGGERLAGGDDDEAAQDVVCLRRVRRLESGEAEQLVEGSEWPRGHVPRTGPSEDRTTAVELIPLTLEAGG